MVAIGVTEVPWGAARFESSSRRVRLPRRMVQNPTCYNKNRSELYGSDRLFVERFGVYIEFDFEYFSEGFSRESKE